MLNRVCDDCGLPATRGGGTKCDTHGVCKHCGLPGVNVFADLCDKHLTELKAKHAKESADLLARARERYRYFIPDNTEVSEFADAGPWRSYQVFEGQADVLSEFLAHVTISEVNQDGGEIDVYGFSEAPYHVQNAILKLINVTWTDVNEVLD